MKIFKRISLGILTGAVSLTALYYGALIMVPNVVDLNRYKESVAAEIEKQSGFKLSCENIEFKRSLTPYFKIHLYHTLVLYPDDETFLKLKEADLKVKILPLLFKKIIVKDAKLTRPIINISLYKDLTNSLDKYINPEKVINTNGFMFNGIVTDTICERYKLKIYDETTNKTFSIEGDELTLKDFKPNQKISIKVKGVLSENEKKYINYDVIIKSFIGKNENTLKVSPFKQILDYDVKGNVSGNLEILKNNVFKGDINFDDFSLKIDDNLLKNNSANIIFKGEEAEISSVLHTSSKDEAKIKGKYNYGKKKYIDLDVNAKNINISKLQKIVNVLSQSLNIPNQFSDVKLTGLLNADFSVNSDFKNLKSKGIAQIINAEVIHKDIPYKINRINSSVNFDNNKIEIEKAQAYINSTPVDITGQILQNMDISLKASSENLDLRAISEMFLKDVKLPVSLIRGKLAFVSEIKGNAGKEIHADTEVNINDFSAVENSKKLPLNVQKIHLKIENNSKKEDLKGSVTLNDFRTIFNGKQIYSKSFGINFDNKKIVIPENIVNIISSPLTVSGVINDYLKKPVGNIDFKGDITSGNIAEILAAYIKEPYKAQGKLNTSGKISFNGDNILFNTKIRSDKDNYLSYVVIKELLNKPSIISIDADIKDKLVSVNNISVKEDSQNKSDVLTVSGQILNEKEPLFKNLKIQIPDYISASMNFFGGEDISLNGNVILNNTLKNPDVKGNIKVQKYNIKKYYTSIKNADVNLANDNIRVIAPEVEVNNSKFNAVLDIEPKITDVITISNAQINSLNLDLNTLFPMIEKERNPFANTVLNVKKGSATINNFKALDLKARDISSDFTLKNNVLKIDGITANSYNGKISGALSYDFNHAALDVNLIGKGLDIKTSLYDLCNIEDNLAGTADFTSSLTMKTGDYNVVLKSLSGKMTFDAKEGRMGTLGKFEYYMNAQNLLYHGLLNATLNRIVDAVKSDNTAKYKTAEGSLFFQNGYLIADDIKTCGKNMSLHLKGRYNMLSNLANIDIYGRISDEIKSKLGSFADVSIAELVNGQPSKKSVSVMTVPAQLLNDIKLYGNPDNSNTNTFRVNVYGNINAPSSINSFSWVVSEERLEDKLPEFSEIPDSI